VPIQIILILIKVILNLVQINKLYEDGKTSDLIYALSQGPDHRACIFNRCFINGFLFQTANIENNLSTQNSGVVVRGDDNTENMDWYGTIKKLSHLIFLIERKLSYFSVTGMMCLLLIRRKVEGTTRINMVL
jgi:hypothetical protein